MLEKKKSGWPMWVKDVYDKKPVHELYDLSKNPKELLGENLSNSSLAKELSEKIEDFKKENALKWKYVKSKDSSAKTTLSEEITNELKALGYLQ
jgi:hypothetical protein